jgi:hypothetical protein
MGFLDNSGDIVLDAVLTDTGRMRLAKGDGSFKISKFCLADDEINYELYDKSHASGSAYYDLEILQTPVMEAFTNNASSVKHRLMSISRTNLLYLPEMLLSTADALAMKHTSGIYIVAVNAATETTSTEEGIGASATSGILHGENPANGTSYIRVDQGLNTSDISKTFAIDSDLKETQYIVEMDNRLGTLVDTSGNEQTVSYIDDDNIASYYLSSTTNSALIADITAIDTSPIAGPRGTKLQFGIKASLEINTSTHLFDKIGLSTNPSIGGVTCRAIDSIIRVVGATTGTSININVRYARKV